MHEHELWFTALLNQTLAGPANAILNAVGIPAHDPSKPWANYMSMQILVAAIIVVVFALLKMRLSADKPGKFQQTFEMMYEFVSGMGHDIVGHGANKHTALFGTLFVFTLFSNLLGVIPTFESPTMYYYVPAGCAVLVFLYYNFHGFKENGVGYLKHFAGPVPLMAPFMFFIEIISHCIRPVSLTIRLYANMLAGEMVTVAFLAMVPLGVPVIFMGLHTFVSFVQAFIFTVLTMVYVAGAVEHEH